MKLRECQALLSRSLSVARILVPDETSLGRTAASILMMAEAYKSDGKAFLDSGDPVNALASCWYGFGWLHFGMAYGLLVTGPGKADCPFSGSCEILPETQGERLREKTLRYQRLLDTARISVRCAPDPSAPAHEFGVRTLFIVSIYACQGDVFLQAGLPEDALACFSYGHGWVDAGVRAGLFTITAERELFTV
jgi:hypothetical protein